MSEGIWTPQFRLLIEIDQYDRAIIRVKATREELRVQSRNAKADLDARTKALETLTESLATLAKTQTQREQELKHTSDRIRRIGSFEHVTNEKELEVAQRELHLLNTRKDALETALFEGMEQQEQDEQRRGFLKNTLERDQKEVARAQAERKVRFEAEGQTLEQLKAERLAVLPGLLPELRGAYDHAMMLHHDRAAVTVQDGSLCPPCRIPVPHQHVVNILVGRSFHVCQHCKRLILPEGLIKAPEIG